MEPIFPPFQPDPEPQKRGLRAVPLRLLVPNLVTLMALAAGLTSIRFAVEGRLEHAALAIVAAAILDGVDGRIARYLKGTSRFGAELDSLADFISFGCAPALVLYFWQLANLKTFGWVVCLLLAFAMALRLARFNVMIDSPARPGWMMAFSVGVPAPAGAMMAMLPLHLSLSGVPHFAGESLLVLGWTLLTAVLTISRVPTFSGKGAKSPVRRDLVLPILAGVAVVLIFLANHPFETISLLTFLYVGLIPVAWRAHRRMAAQAVPARGASE